MAEVLFATLFAWLLLGQLPSPLQFLGGAFILAGIILVRAGELGAAPAPVTERAPAPRPTAERVPAPALDPAPGPAAERLPAPDAAGATMRAAGNNG